MVDSTDRTAEHRWPALLGLLPVLLLGALAWSGAVVRGGFALDDREALESPVVRGATPVAEAFRRDYWHHRGDAGHYRPLAQLSLRLDHSLFGADGARGFHATSVLLHLLVVAAALALARRLAAPGFRVAAALGVAAFAVHPALADAVAWISGRTSTLAALAGLLGALGVHAARGRALGAALPAAAGVLLALLAKEDGLVYGGLAVLVGVARSRRHGAIAALGATLGVLAYLALRAAAFGSPLPSAPDAPLAAVPLAGRLLAAGRGLLEGTRLAALPVGYPPTYSGDPALDPGDAAFSPALATLGWLPWLALLLAGALAARRRPRSLAGWSALLAALSAVPVLQIVPAGEVFAPRFLYPPLLLGAPALGALLVRLPRPVLPILALVAIGLAWDRAGVYASREAYRCEVLAHRPGDVGSWNDLGLAREEEGDAAGALLAWEHAVSLDPGYGRAWSNLGRVLLSAGDLEGAEAALRRAVERGAGNPVARCNLGAVLLRLHRPDEAAASYARATELAPGMAEAWRGLGSAQLEAGRPEQAGAALDRALLLDPSDRRAHALRALVAP